MIDIQINDLKNNNPSEAVNPDIYNEVPQLALAGGWERWVGIIYIYHLKNE